MVTLCYLATASGVTLQWHYCMGKLRSIELGTSADHDACNKCGMKKGSSDCCKDEITVSKISDDHSTASVFAFKSTLGFEPTMGSHFNFTSPALVHAVPTVCMANPPPEIIKNRQVFFCVFRC